MTLPSHGIYAVSVLCCVDEESKMSKSISLEEFAAKWHRSTLGERRGAQEHFLGVCELVGHPTPAMLDPDGTWFAFEVTGEKERVSKWRVDVWKKDYFLWEYEPKGGDLENGYVVIQRVLQSMEDTLPPLFIVCDFVRFVIHVNLPNHPPRVIFLTIDDLRNPADMMILRAVFFNPPFLLQIPNTDFATEQAAVARFERLRQLILLAHHDTTTYSGWIIAQMNGESFSYKSWRNRCWWVLVRSQAFQQTIGDDAIDRCGAVWARHGWVIHGPYGVLEHTKVLVERERHWVIGVPDDALRRR
jgi:hypothetical protein